MEKPRDPGFEICILAGGLSARMGRDKASLRLGSRTLLGHIRRTAAQTGARVRVIRKDVVPRCGPLGGVLTALQTSRSETVLFLSCDMPFVSTSLIEHVANELGRGAASAFVANEGLAGFPFGLGTSLLSKVKEMIERKDLSLQSLAAASGAALVTEKWAAHELFNLNTPSDLRTAKALWREIQSAGGASSNSFRAEPIGKNFQQGDTADGN